MALVVQTTKSQEAEFVKASESYNSIIVILFQPELPTPAPSKSIRYRQAVKVFIMNCIS